MSDACIVVCCPGLPHSKLQHRHPVSPHSTCARAGCATVAEVRKRGDEFWHEFEFYLSDLLVGIVLDVALVSLMAPVAQLGGVSRAASGEATAPLGLEAAWCSLFIYYLSTVGDVAAIVQQDTCFKSAVALIAQ